MKRPRLPLFVAAVLVAVALATAAPRSASAHAALGDRPHDVLVLVFDGLRHDYIRPEIMPNLHAFAQQGIVATQHHVMYPTVTRVNAATLGTGTFPGTHGLMHNQLHLPGKSPDNFNTANADALEQIYRLTEGRILTTTTVGARLDEKGLSMISIGSGSHGSTALLNITAAGHGILNSRGYIRPASLRERAFEVLGEPPPRQQPNVGQDRWAADVYRKMILPADDRPNLTMMWLNEPDATQHRTGVGTPETREALAHVDENFGRILEALDQHGRRERTNIFITTDHGFSTHTGGFNVSAILREHGLADRVHVAAGSKIYVENRDPQLIEQVVRLLQADPHIGPIFTHSAEPGDAMGHVVGTLSLELIRANHPDRAADILATPNWTSQTNEQGYAGTTTAGGTAGHSTLSPHEMQVNMIAAGPDLKGGGLRSGVPTGNVDLAPTALHLLGIELTDTIEGRALHELLVGGPDFDDVPLQRLVHTAQAAHQVADEDVITYQLKLHVSTVDGVPYFSKAVVSRDDPQAAAVRRLSGRRAGAGGLQQDSPHLEIKPSVETAL